MMKKNFYLLVLFTFLTGTISQSITPMQLNGNPSATMPHKPLTSLPPFRQLSYKNSFSNFSTSWADRLLSGAIWVYENPYANSACMLALQGVGSYLWARYGWTNLDVEDQDKERVFKYTENLGYKNLLKDKKTSFNIYRTSIPATLTASSRINDSFDPDIYDVQYNSLVLPNGRNDASEETRHVLRAIAFSRLSQSWLKRDFVPLLGKSVIGLATQIGLGFLSTQLIKKVSTIDNAFVNLGILTLSFSGGATLSNFAGRSINTYLFGTYNRWVRKQAETEAFNKLSESFKTNAPHLKAYKEWLEKMRSKQLCFTKRSIVNQLIFKKAITDTYTPAEIQALCLSTELFEKIAHETTHSAKTTQSAKTALLKEIEDLTGDTDTAHQENIYNAVTTWWKNDDRWNAIVKGDFWTLIQNASELCTTYFPATYGIQDRIDAIDALLAQEPVKKAATKEEELKIDAFAKQLKQSSIMKKIKAWVQTRKPLIEKKEEVKK